jgi:hypothetical protein
MVAILFSNGVRPSATCRATATAVFWAYFAAAAAAAAAATAADAR